MRRPPEKTQGGARALPRKTASQEILSPFHLGIFFGTSLKFRRPVLGLKGKAYAQDYRILEI